MVNIKAPVYVIAIIAFGVINFSVRCAANGMCLPGRSLDIIVLDKMGIPETCRSGVSEYRSSVPSDPTNGFCGVIYTDYGPFKVKESGWSIRGEKREDIVNGISAGCRYSVYYYGGRHRFRDLVEPGSRLRNRGVPVVYSLNKNITCSGES